MWRRGIGVFLAGLVAVLSLPVSSIQAANAGFTVSPAFQTLSVSSGQDQLQYTLFLRNRTATDQSFRLSVVDFGSLDEAGGVAFLGTPATELEHRYGLASWMSLEKDALVVAAGQISQVVVTIQNRASLAPGGHYAAVLATAVTDTGQPAGDPRVGVKQVLSSLILVTKEGGTEKRLDLASQGNNGNWWKLPNQVEQRFENTGNVHVTPRGVTEVREPGGRVVARGALNEASSVILPESFRRYFTPLVTVYRAWLPGRYEVRTTYRYEGTDQTKSFSTHVWYGGLLIVWIVGLLALAGIGWLGWWLWRRWQR
jgi:hypothetical protein